MTKPTYSVYTIIAASGLFCSALLPAWACQFHDDMQQFGAFSVHHPLMQRHHENLPMTKVTLFHKKNTQVETDEEAKVSVTYRVPRIFKHATLKMEACDHIEILRETEMDLVRTAGIIKLKYKATEAGDHSIALVIEALKDGEKEQVKQVININAS